MKLLLRLLLDALSYVSKRVGKVGEVANWFDSKLIGVITWVIERDRAEEIRDQIIVNMNILVNGITDSINGIV